MRREGEIRKMKPRPAFACECGDHCFAALTRGFTVLVSPEDRWLLDRNWYADTGRCGRFAVRAKHWKTGKSVLMSRMIMSAPDGVLVDHANGDTLDNRRGNLRFADYSQNAANRKGPKRDLPKGVKVRDGRYQANLWFRRKRYYLGSFETVEQAHQAYIGAAKNIHGPFARPE